MDADAGVVADPWPTVEATAAVSMHTCTTICCSWRDRIVDDGRAPQTPGGRGLRARPSVPASERPIAIERVYTLASATSGRPGDVTICSRRNYTPR